MKDMWNETNLLREAKIQAEECIEEAKCVRYIFQAENDVVSTFIHMHALQVSYVINKLTLSLMIMGM